MSEHYSGNTISAATWCHKCNRTTQHAVAGHRAGSCLECIARLDAERAERTPTPQPKQEELFK